VLAVMLAASSEHAAAATSPRSTPSIGDVSGSVSDSASGQPLQSAEVSVTQGSTIIANTTTNPFGRYVVHNLPAGSFTITARFIGFAPMSRQVTIAANGSDVGNVDFKLVSTPVNLSAVQVTAGVPVAVDTRTGDQVFKQNDYHGAPTNTTTQILQQSIAGAARAPTGEVHIRGQHAEYTYYVDGVPVSSGISGSLNELFDPAVVNSITFQTGGWDAEYGNKNTAIVNVLTRIPSGGFHMDVGTYGGMYDNNTTDGDRGFNGQSLTVSTNKGRWGVFGSGARQYSGMRLEPVVMDTAADKVMNFHNTGDDLFGFGKLQYTASSNDVVNLDASWSRTKFAVPYDSAGGVSSNDHQTDINTFINLGWRHQFAPSENGRRTADFFGGAFYRHGSLTYAPGEGDDPQFIFFPDTATPYNLSENRNFDSWGVKLDYALRPTPDLEFKFGTQGSITRGHEDFSTFTSTGEAGPASNSTLNGHDIGVYAQTAYNPVEWFELRTGLRYDAHNAPFAGTQTQLSPRIRLNFYPAPRTTLYLYYGRQFIPTNVEDLRAITSVAQGDTVTEPTLPERDNFYEVGAVQRFSHGIALKLAGYRKDSKPGIDDNTVPGSNIVTSVNLAVSHVTGIESVLEVRPGGALSGYANVAHNHAYAHGPITGGFFPADTPAGYFDEDHDQRLSIVGSLTYSPSRLFVSATEIYGTGLTNGVAPADCNCQYGTGLFDFNKGIKVDPSAITNLSAGYTLVVGTTVLRPQLYVENVFNKNYLLKGAFFSGASVGRPRSIQLRVNLGV
jgi:hypothetical protein